MQRTTILAVVLFVGATGCAPSPPKPEELGRLIYDHAQIPSTDKPYQLPELDKSPKDDKSPRQDVPPKSDLDQEKPNADTKAAPETP